jgi:hypothetical protein
MIYFLGIAQATVQPLAGIAIYTVVALVWLAPPAQPALTT